MKLPNWFKVTWWLLLFGAVSGFLLQRYPALTSGTGNAVDALTVLVWFALALVPIFHEIDIFGVKLKREIQELKAEVGKQFAVLQTEVRTSVRTEFSPQINIPYPAPDSQLPDLENQIKGAIESAFRERGVAAVPPEQIDFQISDDVQYLFSVRLGLERELRRIWDSTLREGWVHDARATQSRRYQSIARMTDNLVRAEILRPELGSALREVYAVCSPAVHGEDTSEAQVSFVRDVAPGLITALRAIV